MASGRPLKASALFIIILSPSDYLLCLPLLDRPRVDHGIGFGNWNFDIHRIKRKEGLLLLCAQIDQTCILLHRVLVSDLVMRGFPQIPILLHRFNCEVPRLVQIAHPVANDWLVLGVLVLTKLDNSALGQGGVRCDCLGNQTIVDILRELSSELGLIGLLALAAFFWSKSAQSCLLDKSVIGLFWHQLFQFLSSEQLAVHLVCLYFYPILRCLNHVLRRSGLALSQVIDGVLGSIHRGGGIFQRRILIR